uniref:Uncharacterized protein n=1 Tax=Oryza brachyantha TaxID=4533 RepID=J3N8I7_ORYBR
MKDVLSSHNLFSLVNYFSVCRSLGFNFNFLHFGSNTRGSARQVNLSQEEYLLFLPSFDQNCTKFLQVIETIPV